MVRWQCCIGSRKDCERPLASICEGRPARGVVSNARRGVEKVALKYHLHKIDFETSVQYALTHTYNKRLKKRRCTALHFIINWSKIVRYSITKTYYSITPNSKVLFGFAFQIAWFSLTYLRLLWFCTHYWLFNILFEDVVHFKQTRANKLIYEYKCQAKRSLENFWCKFKDLTFTDLFQKVMWWSNRSIHFMNILNTSHNALLDLLSLPRNYFNLSMLFFKCELKFKNTLT